MHIGLDFDNTIVCYEALFHRVAVKMSFIPPGAAKSKTAVRDYLRREDRESDWIELQSHIYGFQITHAPPFDGVGAFIDLARDKACGVSVISHKTEFANGHPEWNLHEAARGWLAANGLGDISENGLAYFELTRSAKLERIRSCKIDVFVDDLPEFLSEPEFPAAVERILFDPWDVHPEDGAYIKINSWPEIADEVLGRC
jgi:hypothetical protein